MFEKNERFSIRKLTVGAASVMIGAAFIGMAGQTVHAETTDKAEDAKTEIVKSDNETKASDEQVLDTTKKAPVAKAAVADQKTVTPSNKYDPTLNNAKTHQVQTTIQIHRPDIDPMYTNSSIYINKYQTMNKDDNGNWSSITIKPISISDLQDQLPKIEGKHPVFTSSTISNNDVKYLNDYAHRTNAKLNAELAKGVTTTPELEITEPVNEVMFHVYYVKDTPADEWVKTGQTKTFTQTVRTWYQYKVGPNTYTFTYRKTTKPEGIQSKTYTAKFDEYKNGDKTEWRLDRANSSDLNELKSTLYVPYMKGYYVAVFPSYDKDIIPNSAFDKAIAQNNGAESGSDITKLLDFHFDQYKGNSYGESQNQNGKVKVLSALIANENPIYHEMPHFFSNNQKDLLIDVVYVANLQSIKSKVIDQDTNRVLRESTQWFEPTDWTWSNGASMVKLPEGYHLGTKKGNPVPNYDFKTGKYIVNGKEVNYPQLPVGNEDVTYVYYVQKNEVKPVEQEVKSFSNESVSIYGPQNDRDDANSQLHDGTPDFIYTLPNRQDVVGIKDANGKITWKSTPHFDAQNLADILAGDKFNKGGFGKNSNLTLPKYPGYHAVITSATIGYENGFQKDSTELLNKLMAWIKANPNATELPAFDTVSPMRVDFHIHFVKDAQPTTPSTTPDVPTPTPEPQPTDPAPVQPETPQVPDDNTDETAPVKPQDNGSKETTKKAETVRPHATKVAKESKAAVKTAVKSEKVTLPQTGAKKSDAGILGLAIAGLAALLGLAGDKKHED